MIKLIFFLNDLSQFKLTYQAHDFGHETKITL